MTKYCLWPFDWSYSGKKKWYKPEKPVRLRRYSDSGIMECVPRIILKNDVMSSSHFRVFFFFFWNNKKWCLLVAKMNPLLKKEKKSKYSLTNNVFLFGNKATRTYPQSFYFSAILNFQMLKLTTALIKRSSLAAINRTIVNSA